MAENEKINSFEMAKKQVDIVAKYLNLDAGSIEKLKNTKRELIVHFPVRMDDGTNREQKIRQKFPLLVEPI